MQVHNSQLVCRSKRRGDKLGLYGGAVLFLVPLCISCMDIFSQRILDRWESLTSLHWRSFGNLLISLMSVSATERSSWCWSIILMSTASSVYQLYTQRNGLMFSAGSPPPYSEVFHPFRGVIVVTSSSRYFLLHLFCKCDSDLSLPYHIMPFVGIWGSPIWVRLWGNGGIYLLMKLD